MCCDKCCPIFIESNSLVIIVSVVELIESVLAEHSSNGNQLVLQAVRCVGTWAEQGIANSDTEQLIQHLVNVTITSFHSSPE